MFIGADLIDSILILVLILLAYFIGKKVGEIFRDKYWEKKIKEIKGEAIKRSRAVLSGQFSEQLAPYLPDFKYKPTECRFIGKPIDFLVFTGLDDKEIQEVVFVEVKSGKSDLSPVERQLRNIINDQKVSWREYRIPEELTRAKEEKNGAP